MSEKFKRTSIKNGHIHFWKIKNKFTTWNKRHRHKVNLRSVIAPSSKRVKHSHRLLKTEVKRR